MARLILHLKDTDCEYELREQPLRCGRSASNDIPVADDQASREHCRFELEAGTWYVVDLGSSNGTRIDGQRVSRYPLANGTEVQVGNTRITFVAEPPAPAEVPAAAPPAAPPVAAPASVPAAPPAGPPAPAPPAPAAAPEHVLALLAVGGPCDGETFDLRTPSTRIGRKPDNDVVLEDPAVSGHHAELVRDGAKARIIDKNSRNGVKVNKVRISERELDDGDEIQIGSTTLVFRRGAPPEKAAPEAAAPAAAEAAPGPAAATAPARRWKLLPVAVTVAVTAVAVLAAWFVYQFFSGGIKPPPEEGENLLKDNPSFETAGPGLPGWSLVKGSASIDREKGADGALALRLSSSPPAGSDLAALCWSAEVPVESGKACEVSALVKNTRGESAALAVEWTSRAQPWLRARQLGHRTSDATDWRRERDLFGRPSWATGALVGCAVIGQGLAKFDAVRLRAVAEPHPPAQLSAGRIAFEPRPSGELVLLADGDPMLAEGRLAVTATGRPLSQATGVLENGFPRVDPRMVRFVGKLGPDAKVPYTEVLSTDGAQVVLSYDVRPPAEAGPVVAFEFRSGTRLLRDSVTLEAPRGVTTTESAPFENRTEVTLITFGSGAKRVFLALNEPATVSASEEQDKAATWRIEFPAAVRGDRTALSLTWAATDADKDAVIAEDLKRAADAEAAEEWGKAAKVYQDFIEKHKLRTADRADAARRLKALRAEVASRIERIDGLAARARASQDEADFLAAERAAEILLDKLRDDKGAEPLAKLLTALKADFKAAQAKKQEKEASDLVAAAKRDIERKEFHTARVRLKEVLLKFAGTQFAQEASELLKSLPEP